MSEASLTRTLAALPDVVTLIASEENGAPQMAWGDSFFYYDPDDNPDNRKLPFATIVVGDYPGFDTASNLDRPGVYRLNLAVGRERFTSLFGFSPAEFAGHQSEFDYTEFDRVIPHPVYASQGWASIVVPGDRTEQQAEELIVYAHERARLRHRPAR